MTPAAPRYRSAAVTDQGHVRSNNEDRVYCDDSRGFFLVVDGMGGREAGEHAAEIAVERIRIRLERETDTVDQRIREAITLANNAVYEAAQSRADWNGMACVLTLAVVGKDEVTVGHVGDSRLYKIRREVIEKITHDHSPVGEREDSGELSEAEAMRHPRRNEVYRDVGSEEHAPDDDDFIEVLHTSFGPEEALLLCSDGLSDAISSADILAIIKAHAGDRRSTVQALIDAAKARGKDNISAVFVEGERFAESLRHSATPAPVKPLASTNNWTRYLYGAIVGAALTFAALHILPGKQPAPGPERIVVTSPATISAAITRAKPGDTVSVTPGTYAEAIHLRSDVDVIAERTHEVTLEGAVLAEGVQRTRLEGFRIHSADGIRIQDGDVTLSRNEVSGSRGPGVEFRGSSRSTLLACWIHDNKGPGVAILDSALATIESNVISANGVQPRALRPGLIVSSSLRPKITGNTFLANGTDAIWLSQPDETILERNFFGATTGKPIHVRVLSSAEVARELR